MSKEFTHTEVSFPTSLVCINCPKGCILTVNKENDQLLVSGQSCKKGPEYAISELTCPTRILTCLMRPAGSEIPLSVKTDQPVPKDLLMECAKAIYQTHPALPIHAGDVLIEDLLGTGANVIATRSLAG